MLWVPVNTETSVYVMTETGNRISVATDILCHILLRPDCNRGNLKHLEGLTIREVGFTGMAWA